MQTSNHRHNDGLILPYLQPHLPDKTLYIYLRAINSRKVEKKDCNGVIASGSSPPRISPASTSKHPAMLRNGFWINIHRSKDWQRDIGRQRLGSGNWASLEETIWYKPKSKVVRLDSPVKEECRSLRQIASLCHRTLILAQLHLPAQLSPTSPKPLEQYIQKQIPRTLD
jgi:hypothetical protein